MRPLTWKLLQSKVFFKDRWLSMRVNTYQLPDGRTIEPCYLFEYNDWVNIVAITPDQQVVLVRQFRHGVGETLLELPGGTMDPGETSPLAAAQRELLEETGYQSGNWIETGFINPNPVTHNNRNYCFLALDVKLDGEQHLDDMEDLDVLLMPLDEVIAVAQASGFRHTLQVSSLFFALSKLGRIR